MSFTEDELQAFNAILEQRFLAHRQEMELALDQRLNTLRDDLEQQLVSAQQAIAHGMGHQFRELKEQFIAKLDVRSAGVERLADRDAGLIEAAMDRMLAAQLLGIEQLLNQSVSRQVFEQGALSSGARAQMDAIEVQTEVSWEDLVEVIGKALDERLVSLNTSLQRSFRNLEQYLSTRLHNLRDEIVHNSPRSQPYLDQMNDLASVQEILSGIEHLEQVMESLQVAMTANQALISNRLYHHQHLPLERAHPVGLSRANGAKSSLSLAKEHIAGELDADISVTPREIEGPDEQ